ncbi:MAG: DHA2 family efflux MFS transporter permease subunit [Acidobacteriota bacterium]|nr:DHA2 family efflux MFS transporter permease subunit [Acidobacteriota bacterium]
MSVLDSTVVNVSLPKMAGDLSSTPTEVIWVISSYIVANAAILPISGWLATYFGRKNYYMACVLGFTVTSVLCGLATSLESLIFFRILQGLSAGGIAPSEQAIIADVTPRNKLGRIFSIYGLGLSLAPIMGPTLGGYITDTLSWHWIFFINLPIGIVSLILTGIFVKESQQSKELTRESRKGGNSIDWLGIVLFVSGIAALELVLGEGPKEGWFESDFIFLLLGYSIIALLIGVTWEYYQKKPAVDITMFKDRGFAGSCILILTVSFVISGAGFLIPFFTQTLLGYTAMDAGMIGLPGTICQLIVIQAVGYASDKTDIRRIIFIGLVLTVFAVWNFSNFNLNIGYDDLVMARVYFSISIAFLAATVNTVAYYGVPPEKNNSASSLLNLARNMGASFGIALTSTIISVQSQVHINEFSAHTNLLNSNYTEAIRKLAQVFQNQGIKAMDAVGVAQGTMWKEILRQATMNSILDAVQVFVILHICVVPMVFLLKRKKPDV